MKKITLSLTALSLLITGSYAVVVSADHAWGKYHWDLSTEQTDLIPLELGDNLSPSWSNSLDTAVDNWNLSVLKSRVGDFGSNANCDPTPGRIEVCNGSYGPTGWLGIASIWATRGKINHITQATVRVNDTYFNSPPYNTEPWKVFVMCQEVGHTFGLDHQDGDFYNVNLGTCMDYTNDPDGTINGELSNLYPNQDDYDHLADIYAHLNSTDGGGGGSGAGGGRKPKKSDTGEYRSPNNPSEWGQAVRQDAQGRNSVFERTLSNGQILITHVLWAI